MINTHQCAWARWCDEGQLKSLFRHEFIWFNCADFIIIYNWEINDHSANKFSSDATVNGRAEERERERGCVRSHRVREHLQRFAECMHGVFECGVSNIALVLRILYEMLLSRVRPENAQSAWQRAKSDKYFTSDDRRTDDRRLAQFILFVL